MESQALSTLSVTGSLDKHETVLAEVSHNSLTGLGEITTKLPVNSHPGVVQILLSLKVPVLEVLTGAWGIADSTKVIMPDAAKQQESFTGHQLVGIRHAEGILFVEVHDSSQMDAIFRVEKQGEEWSIQIDFDCSGLPTVSDVPKIFLREPESWKVGLQGFARDVATKMEVKSPGRPMRSWCSWYYAYHNLSESLLKEWLDGFDSLPADMRPEVVQIDAGYFPSVGDWLEPNHLWPSGLGAAAKMITSRGYRAGIWIGPYMVGNRSRLFSEHPDWMLRELDGSRIVKMRLYGEQRLWGHRDEEMYILDSSHPEAFEYLRSVFRSFREMGFDYFKTDFLEWGHQSSRKVTRFAPGKTGNQYMRDLLKMIREEIGEESYWLGCIAPYAPCIGFPEGMRVGGDVVPDWNEHSPNSALVEVLPTASHMNSVWWHNDPDSILLRDFHTSLSDEEAEAMAWWQGIHSGVLNTSDPIHLVSEIRQSWWKEMCQFGPSPAEQIFLSDPRILGAERLVSEAGEPKEYLLVLINTSHKESVCVSGEWAGGFFEDITIKPKSCHRVRKFVPDLD